MAEEKKKGFAAGFLNIIKKKIEKKKAEDKEKAEGVPQWMKDIKSPSDRRKAMLVHELNKKRKNKN